MGLLPALSGGVNWTMAEASDGSTRLMVGVPGTMQSMPAASQLKSESAPTRAITPPLSGPST
jgi:hypothetical protein